MLLNEDAIFTAWDGCGEKRRYKPLYPVESIEGVRSGDTDDLTWSWDGTYVVIDAWAVDTTVAYYASGYAYDVQPSTSTLRSPVTMTIDGECSTHIDENNGKIPCEQGVNYPINLVDELNVSVSKIAGKTFHVTDPGGADLYLDADAFGVIVIESVTNGTYTIDTGDVIRGSKIYLKVNAA